MASKTPRVDKIEKAIFGGTIDTAQIAAPNTEIVNEHGQSRQIPDLANNMKVSGGNERITFNSITPLVKEFGPNGEKAYELDTKDARIRFVGDWANISNTRGTYTASIVANDFAEITFWGTGLSILEITDGTTRDYGVTTDGGSESTINSIGSDIIGTRSVNSNLVFPIVSGLSEGIHTVKIRISGGANILGLSGVDILNDSTQLTINPGKPLVGNLAREILSTQNLPFKPTSFTGSKGGRVLLVQDGDGVISQKGTETDSRGQVSDPTELVTNGTFDSDISGWTQAFGPGVWTGSAIQITTAGTGIGVLWYQEITVVAGQTYLLSGDVVAAGTNGASFYVQDGTNGSAILEILGVGVPGGTSLSGVFTPTGTTVTISLGTGGSPPGNYATFDNISTKEAFNFLTLENSDHSEEEIISRKNFRDFGANRADDFSTLTGSSDRAFTLNDGTTTLVGENVAVANDLLYMVTNNVSFITLTFVGTGLDITWGGSAGGGTNSTASSQQFTIDGGTPINWTTVGSTENIATSICSGLPYGTHTVTFIRNAPNVWSLAIKDFLIYGPKKPTLDAEDNVLADYNVMADFIANTTQGLETMSTGVLRKMGTREFTYKGSWNALAIDVDDFITGFNTWGGIGATVEYTFFGTGFDFRFESQSDTDLAAQLELDGSTDFSSFTTSVYGAEMGFTAATGVLDQRSTAVQQGNGLVVSGLSLGLHTIKITSSVTVFRVDTFDIITPIHINDMKTGSLSLKDEREDIQVQEEQDRQVDLGKAKALVVFDSFGGANEILFSHNISAVIDMTTGTHRFYFEKPFKNKNYVVTGMGSDAGGFQADRVDKTAGSCKVIQRASDGALRDSLFTLAFFGELEDEGEE